MANTVESILPGHIRKVFEQFGVIKHTAWPKLDVLVKAITNRKMRFDLESDQQGTCTARVFALGTTYTAVDGEPERALARAFYDCLKETGSAQLGMFDGDDSDDDAYDDHDYREEDEPGHMIHIKDVTVRTDEGLEHIRTRTVDGETFVMGADGRYVNTETGEVLDAFEVPRPMTAGR